MDAVCVGEIAGVEGWEVPTLTIKAMGRGSYQRTRLDTFGFPRGYLMREKSINGFRTGDLVTADVRKGKKIGHYFGRVAIRESGYFNIQGKSSKVEGISHKCCKIVQKGNGYGYFLNPTEKGGVSSPP